MDRGVRSPDDGEDDRSTLVLLGQYSGHGLTIAAATGFFLLLGWWVDGRLGLTPLFTVIGALVGAGAGFYSMLQHVLLRPRAAESDAAASERDRGRDVEGGAGEGDGRES